MTKQFVFAAAVLFCLGLMSACQKEVSYETPQNVFGDSIYIDSIFSINFLPTEHDTTNIWTYSYDAQKRVINMQLKAWDINDSSITKYDYFYHNNDTLPYKSIVTNKYYDGVFSTQLKTIIDTCYHFFDNTGRKVTDSIIRFNGGSYRLHKLNYTSGKIFQLRKMYYANGQPSNDYNLADTAFVDNNGNVYSTRTYVSPFIGLTSLFAKTEFTYDSHRSPLSYLSNFKTFNPIPTGETLYEELPHFNNRISQNEFTSVNSPNPKNFKWNYQNNYKANGLVDYIIAVEIDNSLSDTMRFDFRYKAL